MTNWMTVYDGVFFISIATIIVGFLGLSVKYCLKSKCERFSVCFGLFEIQRRVDLVVQEEMAQFEMGITDNEEEEVKTSQPKVKRPSIRKSIIEEKKTDLEEKEDNNV